MKELKDCEVDAFIKDGLVCLDFYAVWCGPCTRLSELLTKLQLNFSNIKFAKVNIEDAVVSTTQYNVVSLPTVVLFKDGVKVDRIEGLLPERKLIERLEALRKS